MCSIIVLLVRAPVSLRDAFAVAFRENKSNKTVIFILTLDAGRLQDHIQCYIFLVVCRVFRRRTRFFFILVSWCTYVVIDKLIKSHERMAQNAPLRVCRKWCDLRCVNCLRLTYMKIYFHKFNSDAFCSVRDVASWLGWW